MSRWGWGRAEGVAACEVHDAVWGCSRGRRSATLLLSDGRSTQWTTRGPVMRTVRLDARLRQRGAVGLEGGRCATSDPKTNHKNLPLGFILVKHPTPNRPRAMYDGDDKVHRWAIRISSTPDPHKHTNHLHRTA